MVSHIKFTPLEIRHTVISLMVLLIVSGLGGCASERSGIGVAVTQCCVNDASAETRSDGASSSQDVTVYETFVVMAEEIPAFLGPLMVSNFSVALSHHGLQPVVSEPDLVVTLRYVQNNLTRHRQRDDFEERISTGDSERFAARVAIEFRDAITKDVVWSGHIERIHDVGPGEWMHTGRASVAIYDSFVEILKDYGR